jgi:hypothetical protein
MGRIRWAQRVSQLSPDEVGAAQTKLLREEPTSSARRPLTGRKPRKRSWVVRYLQADTERVCHDFEKVREWARPRKASEEYDNVFRSVNGSHSDLWREP